MYNSYSVRAKYQVRDVSCNLDTTEITMCCLVRAVACHGQWW